MRHRELAIGLLASFAFPLAAAATTTAQEVIQCPLCGKSFVIVVIRSYSRFGPPARDLGDDPAFMCNPVVTCPSCLYSSLSGDFEEVSEEARGRIRAILPSIGRPLREALHRRSIDVGGRDDQYWLFGIELARLCYAQREPDPWRDVFLLRHGYGSNRHEPASQIHLAYRQELIKALSDVLKTVPPGSEDAVVHVYLLGELLRQAGDSRGALENFAEARRQAASLEQKDLVNWLTACCDEQSFRVEAASMNVVALEAVLDAEPRPKDGEEPPFKIRAAVGALADRHSPEAWAVLLRFCQRSSENLLCLDDEANLTKAMIRIHPPMREWIRGQYLIARHRSPASQPAPGRFDAIAVLNRFQHLFDRKHIDFEPLEEVEASAAELLSTVVDPDIGRLPQDWDPGDAVRLLAVAIANGDARALRLFVAWARTAEPDRETEYDFGRCLDALAGTRTLQALALQLTADMPPAASALPIRCIHLVCGDESSVPQLIETVRSAKEWNSACTAVRDAFAGARHSGLKKVMLDRWERDSKLVFYWPGCSYFDAVGDTADLVALEGLANKADSFLRHEMESAIRTIRLRVLLASAAASRPAGR